MIIRCKPMTNADMAPKKLQNRETLSCAFRNVQTLNSPADIIQGDNGPLKVRIRIAHGVQEALSDNDSAKDTLIISYREDHIKVGSEDRRRPPHQIESSLLYKQRSPRY
jgi:hypothetical protein